MLHGGETIESDGGREQAAERGGDTMTDDTFPRPARPGDRWIAHGIAYAGLAEWEAAQARRRRERETRPKTPARRETARSGAQAGLFDAPADGASGE